MSVELFTHNRTKFNKVQGVPFSTPLLWGISRIFKVIKFFAFLRYRWKLKNKTFEVPPVSQIFFIFLQRLKQIIIEIFPQNPVA